MAKDDEDAPYPSDEYHFHRCPVAGCGASILCTGQTAVQCEARIARAVAEEEALNEPPRGSQAPEVLARNREMSACR